MKLKFFTVLALFLGSTNVNAENIYKNLNNVTLNRDDVFKPVNLIRDDISNKIKNKDFKGIDKAVTEEFKSDEMLLDGRSKHTVYLYFINDRANSVRNRDEESWLSLENLAEQWQESDPTSAVPYIFYSSILKSKAWIYRGNNYVDQIPKDDMEMFVNLQIKNIEYLNKNKKYASKDPTYFIKLMEIYKTLGMSNEAYYTYKEGIEKFPQYRQIYSTYLAVNDKKWLGGYEGLLKEVLDDAVKGSSRESQDVVYYHILRLANSLNYYLPNEIDVDWDRVERGMVQSIEVMPTFYRFASVVRFMCSYGGNETRVENLMKSFGGNSFHPRDIERTMAECEQIRLKKEKNKNFSN